MKKVIAYEGLPVEAEGIEDPEEMAAIVGSLGEVLKRLGLRRLELSASGMVVAEG